MNIRLKDLVLRTRKTTEHIALSSKVTFLHGPVSTGKSTVARLIDYCFGGEIERTPAIQREFIAAELSVVLGPHLCTLERSSEDHQSVRVTWADGNDVASLNAPFDAQPDRLLLDAEVYNLSDLLFHLCQVAPIKVRKRSRDPESPLIRLSFRDIWWYCYLEQIHLDSSFFRLEDPFRGRKSQDAMRFFTGLHSERLSQLEGDLMRAVDEQRAKREAVQQIREFMVRFELGSELEIAEELESTRRVLNAAEGRRSELEAGRAAQTHPTDALRIDLRKLGAEIARIGQAISESEESIAEQKALRAEFITAKIKAERVHVAASILEGVHYQRCPDCGTDVSERAHSPDRCGLCGSVNDERSIEPPIELEVLRRDLNERIDQIADSVTRRDREVARMKRQLKHEQERKAMLDRQLQKEIDRYDSAFVESIRAVERETATLTERIRSLERLRQMPRAIDQLEEQAGSLQGRIDRLRRSANEERYRLRAADANIAAIAEEFKRIMLAVSFPGVMPDDSVVIDPRNWLPEVVHGDFSWSFWDAGSGGKKTLFNVCYALAVHAVALDRGLPVPTVLIIDSPTKNISEDENPELVRLLYDEIYRLAQKEEGGGLQLLLIDSDLVKPNTPVRHFSSRRLAGLADAPSLIPYYSGP